MMITSAVTSEIDVGLYDFFDSSDSALAVQQTVSLIGAMTTGGP